MYISILIRLMLFNRNPTSNMRITLGHIFDYNSHVSWYIFLFQDFKYFLCHLKQELILQIKTVCILY